MNYPINISKNENGQYMVMVPDLPGCSVQSESIEKSFGDVKDAIASHLMILAEYGEAIPPASSIETLNTRKIVGEVWGLVEIDITPFLGKSHKINVTLPELLIKQIDDRVSKSDDYKSRSGFIAQACIAELRKS
ncbi:type II toxin-antitoxin system HicB family antitoxin [Thalassotalea euphylliae]|uniref:type II toxin-antitoxin system HicB family antitoxin n=1 Tax=Thalassotalea euphylliae TaxID=1655234 RepID=UPI003634156F